MIPFHLWEWLYLGSLALQLAMLVVTLLIVRDLRRAGGK